MKQNCTARTLSLLLCLAVWVFIFSNSLQGATLSSERSDAVLEMVNRVLHEMGGGAASARFIRKMAHFVEFALLGGSLTLALRYWTPLFTPLRRLSLAVVIGICSAAVDETIQIFSDGRAASVADVLLDSSGVFTGALLTTGLMLIFIKTE